MNRTTINEDPKRVGLTGQVSRPIYLHFLDRELLTVLGSYETLTFSSIERDVRTILISAYESLYFSMSLVFENKFARRLFSKYPSLFQSGNIFVALNENSIKDFASIKRSQYPHAKDSYAFYFDDTWEKIAGKQPVLKNKKTDTTAVLEQNVVPHIERGGALDSAQRLNMTINGKEAKKVSPRMIEAIYKRSGRAITRLLFAPAYERFQISDLLRRSFDIVISEQYVTAYLSDFGGTIATGLNSGLVYFSYLCPTYPIHDLALWRQIYQRLGCWAVISQLNAGDIIALRNSALFQNFVDEARYLIFRIVCLFPLDLTSKEHIVPTFDIERILRALIKPVYKVPTSAEECLQLVGEAATWFADIRDDVLVQCLDAKPLDKQRLVEAVTSGITASGLTSASVPIEHLSPTEFKELVRLIQGISRFTNVRERRGFVEQAVFGFTRGEELLAQLELDGAPISAAVATVRLFDSFGMIGPTYQASIVLLEALRHEVGDPAATWIDGVIARLSRPSAT